MNETPIDMERVLEEFGNDSEFLFEVVEEFMTALSGQIEQMRQATGSGDAATIYMIAHQIKGAAGNLIAHELAEIARKIELCGKNCQLETLPNLLETFEQAAGRLSLFIESEKELG